MIAVLCVLRSGGRYSPEWVHRLERGVARNLTLPHRFVCLTDMPGVSLDCHPVPLSTNWPGWWAKLELFQFRTKCLYLDLDSVVVGSLDAIAAAEHKFTMTHEYYRPHLMCSTAMAWDGDFSFLWREMARKDDTKKVMKFYDNWTPEGRIGDQGYIEETLTGAGYLPATFRDRFGERSIASYKVHCRKDGLQGNESVVAFHGNLKPDQLGHVDWIRENWI